MVGEFMDGRDEKLGFYMLLSGLVSWLFLYLRVGFRNFLSGSSLVEALVSILPSGGGGGNINFSV